MLDGAKRVAHALHYLYPFILTGSLALATCVFNSSWQVVVAFCTSLIYFAFEAWIASRKIDERKALVDSLNLQIDQLKADMLSQKDRLDSMAFTKAVGR